MKNYISFIKETYQQEYKKYIYSFIISIGITIITGVLGLLITLIDLIQGYEPGLLVVTIFVICILSLLYIIKTLINIIKFILKTITNDSKSNMNNIKNKYEEFNRTNIN